MPNSLFSLARWRFVWRYLRGRTPWDTHITPPEVMAFIETTPPGRALDLGCGTGTNAVTLARHGWRVAGIDFVPQAIRAARAKAAAAGLKADFYQASVINLEMLTGPYDYALDIGCLFTLTPEDQRKYVAHLVRLLGPGAWFMLYAWQPRLRDGRPMGISPEAVHGLLHPAFFKIQVVLGEEKGFPSAWYWYRRQ